MEIKEKIKKEYLRGIRKLLETKLYCRNFVKRINPWDVPLVRYSWQFLKWTRQELKQMDQRTRKLMTMHKALHPRDDVDSIYASRKKERRGLASIEDSVDASIQRLEYYVEKRRRVLITATRNNAKNTRTSGTTITRRKKNRKKNNSVDVLSD